MKDLQDYVPKSLKTALALITVLVPILTVVMNYALYGYRITQLEQRITNDEQDQQRRNDQLGNWQSQISTDVATTRTNVEWLVRKEQTKP